VDGSLEERLERAAEHRKVVPGSVAAAELGARADEFARAVAQVEQNLLRAAAAFDGDLDAQPGFDALDYMLEKIGRVEQDAASLRHTLEQVTGRTRPRLAPARPRSNGVLDAAAGRLEQWCQQRVPERARHQVRVEVKRRGRTLTIVERRPPWPSGEGQWTSMPIAQFRLDDAGTWTLWWADRNNRWHEYDDAQRGMGFEALLREVDEDPTAVFWG
jgi:hypothetical protein